MDSNDHTIRDKARLKLDQLEREVEELRAFIRTFNRLEKTSARTDADEAMVGKASNNIAFGAKIDVSQLPSSREKIISTARTVLKEAAPSPVHINDLFQAMIDKGIVVGGQNPKGNLSAKLSQPDDIIYVKDEGWYYLPPRPQGVIRR